MKATIIECVMGILGFGENNEVTASVLFSKDPKQAAENLTKIETGKVTDEIAALIAKLKEKGYITFVFEKPELARNAHERLGIEIVLACPSIAGELLRSNLRKFAVESGFVENESELREWTHNVSMELTKIRVRRAAGKRDLVVSQTIQTIDDLDKTLNLMMGRIREWYGLHFPELDRLVEKHETYARLINDLGRKENFTAENLEKESLPKNRTKTISEVANSSMGADFSEEDISQIQNVCRNILELFDSRKKLENHLDVIMDEVAPNTRTMVGSLLGARLIAISGGLSNLAKMPASTVQVLGAEKALFRALKTGAKPPKHGLIFQHSLIHDASPWQRGKIARALAGKLAIAARTDAFSGKYSGYGLKSSLERRITEIKERYKEAPPPKRPRPEKFQRGRRKRGFRKG